MKEELISEELISLEIAKLCKELNFKFNTNTFYCDSYEGLCTEYEESLYVESLKKVIYDCNGYFDEGERYLAPTQSLLQTYLRKKYNIAIDVFFDNISITDNSIKIIYAYKTYFNYIKFKNINGFETYELALEDALYQSLLIIKQNKNNENI